MEDTKSKLPPANPKSEELKNIWLDPDNEKLGDSTNDFKLGELIKEGEYPYIDMFEQAYIEVAALKAMIGDKAYAGIKKVLKKQIRLRRKFMKNEYFLNKYNEQVIQRELDKL